MCVGVGVRLVTCSGSKRLKHDNRLIASFPKMKVMKNATKNKNSTYVFYDFKYGNTWGNTWGRQTVRKQTKINLEKLAFRHE